MCEYMASASSQPNEFPLWQCQTNPNPFDPDEPSEWTDYPHDVSEAIEEAYQDGIDEIVIRTGYIIVLTEALQIHSADHHRQRPIRRGQRQQSAPLLPSASESEQANQRQERLSSPLNSDSSGIDTHYQGSRFIINWLIHVAGCSSKVPFDQIFPMLIRGLESEARQNPIAELNASIEELRKVGTSTSLRGKRTRMTVLRETCIRLYTSHSDLYYIIN